jgi:Fe2+ transport system protein B
MAEFTTRELIEAIYDVRDRVTRIEEQLINRTEQINRRAEDAYMKADTADKQATLNKQNIMALEKRIDGLMLNVRWAWGIAIPSLLTIVGFIITFLTR